MKAHRRYQHACRSPMGVLAAAWAMTAVLAGCAGSALNGHPAPSLSTNSPSSPTTSGPGTQGPPVTTQQSNPASTASRLASTASTPAGNASRPSRPNSVIATFFESSYVKPCIPVEAGSQDATIQLKRLVKQKICFMDLGVSTAPSLVVTTPAGAREVITLTPGSPGSGDWVWLVQSVPGLGLEASLGQYTFRMITAVPSSTPTGASASVTTSPPPRFIVTSGNLTIIPVTQPSAEVSSDPQLAGDQLQIGLSGFPAFSMVYVSLYGPGASDGQGASAMYPLLVDLPGLRTDQHAEGAALWTVPSGTADGRYAIWIDPLPAACKNNPCISFTVTS